LVSPSIHRYPFSNIGRTVHRLTYYLHYSSDRFFQTLKFSHTANLKNPQKILEKGLTEEERKDRVIKVRGGRENALPTEPRKDNTLKAKETNPRQENGALR
jgi:hypothetical protein